MELKEQQKILQDEAQGLALRLNHLKAQAETIERKLGKVLAKKHKIEIELAKIEIIPPGRSGKPKKAKPLDINEMSDAAAALLLQQLLKLQEDKA